MQVAPNKVPRKTLRVERPTSKTGKALVAADTPNGAAKVGPAKKRQGSGSASDQELLARAIAAEARGESYSTKVAVGAAIVNYARATGKALVRVIRSTFLSSNQDHNRRFYRLPPSRIPDWQEHVKAAGEALNGRSPIGKRSHFVDDSIGPPKWVDPSSGKRMGNMIFYNPRSDVDDIWRLPDSFRPSVTERA